MTPPRGGQRPGAGRPQTNPTTRVSLRLPHALLAAIREAALREGITSTEWLRRVARRALPPQP